MKIDVFWFKLYWSLLSVDQLAISQHWFKQWPGGEQVTSQYLNQWLLILLIHASLGLNELIGPRESDCYFNTLRPRQNGRHFADDIFKCIFLNENVWISIKVSLKFVPNGLINNMPALVQIMAWRRSGDKSLSESMMLSLPTHICVPRPQWVKNVISKCNFMTQSENINPAEMLRWFPKLSLHRRFGNLLVLNIFIYPQLNISHTTIISFL